MASTGAKSMIELDGRTLEGGGQLIRSALCLAALTGLSVRIDHIRGNRSGGGGLKAQHLACVNWLAHACNAQVQGNEKGSKTLVFNPGHVDSDLSPAFTKRTLSTGNQIYECNLDIGTAGSTGLALQAILPYILFTKFPSQLPIRLKVSGGTNVSGSPSYEYISQVLLPTLWTIGFPDIQIDLGRRGWSHGGSSIGNFTLTIPARRTVVLPTFMYHPNTNAPSTTLRRPSRLKVIFIAPASCFGHFRTVVVPAVEHHFGDSSEVDGGLEIVCEGSLHEKRMYLIMLATIPGGTESAKDYILARDWLYDRKIKTHERSATEMAERVAKDLAKEWLSGAWVDEHMRDQLVIFQALARGRCKVYPGMEEEDGDDDDDDDVEEEMAHGELREPSLHARTAEWVAKQMLGVKFDAEGTCEGVGFGGDEARGVDEDMASLDISK